MTYLPEKTILGRLHVLEVYEHYDFPRIFSCKNETGQIYVVLSIHDDDALCRWLYLPISPRRYNTLCDSGMSLKDCIQNPENGFLFLLETYPDGSNKIDSIFAEQLSDDDLPSSTYFLSSIGSREESPFDLDVNRVAKSIRRESFNYHIFPNEKRKHEIPARKLGAVLATSQELIDALGQAATGNPTVRGAISAEILSQTRVNVCHFFTGSFGVQFQAWQQADLLDNALVADAIREFSNLILAADSEDHLSNKLHALRGRVASKYRRLLKELNDIDSGIRLDWGAVAEGQGGIFELTKEQVSRAYSIVDRIDIEMSEEKIVHGRLVGFNSRTKRYEILSSEDNKSYSGKVSEDAVLSVDHPAIDDNYYATLRMLVETQSSSGDELIRWVMVALNESDPNTSGI